MQVFDRLDKEQAAMYRWIRDTCDASTFQAITGQSGWMKLGEMEMDKAFRDAFARYEASRTERVTAHAQLSAGILPASLGIALHAFAESVEECATFAEGLSGQTFGDVNRARENAFDNLIDEIRKLQR